MSARYARLSRYKKSFWPPAFKDCMLQWNTSQFDRPKPILQRPWHHAFSFRLVSIIISYTLLVALVGRPITLWARLHVSRLQRKTKPTPLIATSTTFPIEDIMPLHDFQYETVEPIKYRPFETKRHVAMGTPSKCLTDRFLQLLIYS